MAGTGQWKRVQNSLAQGRRGTGAVRVGEEITCNVMQSVRQWDASTCGTQDNSGWGSGITCSVQGREGSAMLCNARL